MSDVSIGNIEIFSDNAEAAAEYYKQLLGVKFDEKMFPNRMYVGRIGDIFWIIHDTTSMPNGTQQDPGMRIGLLKDSEWGSSGESTQANVHNNILYQGRNVLHRDMREEVAPDGVRVGLLSILSNLPEPKKDIQNISRSMAKIWHVLGFYIKFKFRLNVSSLQDRYEYLFNKVTYLNHDIDGFTHIVASREGLYIVNKTSYKKVLRGRFYGVSIGPDGSVYCFQDITVNIDKTNRGRILKLELNDSRTRILGVKVCITGLDAGCHQIDFIGPYLYIVDCFNCKILRTDDAVSCIEESFSPLGEMSRKEAGYGPHINSLSAHPDGTIWILLHNNGLKSSEIIIVNKAFEIQRRFSIDAGMAHNIVFSNDENNYLVCDSFRGRIIGENGSVVKVGKYLPRGISLDKELCVVGDSCFQTRLYRRYVPGNLHFYEAGTWNKIKEMSIPAAPTEIRKLDGQDRSLSNFIISQ